MWFDWWMSCTMGWSKTVYYIWKSSNKATVSKGPWWWHGNAENHDWKSENMKYQENKCKSHRDLFWKFMASKSIKKGTRHGSKISNSQNGFIPIRKCCRLCSLKLLLRLCCASAPALSSSSSLPSTCCGHTYLHSLDYHLVSQKSLFYHVLGIELAIIHNVSWIKLPICFHA